MFVPTILGQGTVEQQGEWLGKAWNLQILGTYAQVTIFYYSNAKKNEFDVIVKFINISTEFVRPNLGMEHSSVALKLEQPMTKKLKSSFCTVHR